MATLEFKPPQPVPPEPELNFLMPEGGQPSLWASLTQNFKQTFFPEKLPPLVLTSQPVPVKDIWGFYDEYRKKSATASTIAHIVVIALMILGTIYLGRRVVMKAEPPVVTILAPSNIPVMQPSKTKVGGGGGGGDRDKFNAPKGKIPKQSLTQITPPAIVVRNLHPKLAVEPTVVVPPQVKLAYNAPNLGNPTAAMPSGPPSNGTGSGGGIGSGSGGGIGVGSGAGVGEGHGGGTGGGVFRVGGGVSKPRLVYAPDPEYSEEARKAKFMGTCTLSLIVGADGRARDIQVSRSVGLGLDEKAIEAVKTWKFDPAMKDGKPVAVAIAIEVTFHLY
jgi:protein TonB